MQPPVIEVSERPPNADAYGETERAKQSRKNDKDRDRYKNISLQSALDRIGRGSRRFGCFLLRSILTMRLIIGSLSTCHCQKLTILY